MPPKINTGNVVDSSYHMKILWGNCLPSSMNTTKVGTFKEANQPGFCCLLQCQDGSTLETKIHFEIMSDFPDQPLKRKERDQEINTLLVATNLSHCNNGVVYTGFSNFGSTTAIATTSSTTLVSCLCSQLLMRGLTSFLVLCFLWLWQPLPLCLPYNLPCPCFSFLSLISLSSPLQSLFFLFKPSLNQSYYY